MRRWPERCKQLQLLLVEVLAKRVLIRYPTRRITEDSWPRVLRNIRCVRWTPAPGTPAYRRTRGPAFEASTVLIYYSTPDTAVHIHNNSNNSIHKVGITTERFARLVNISLVLQVASTGKACPPSDGDVTKAIAQLRTIVWKYTIDTSRKHIHLSINLQYGHL